LAVATLAPGTPDLRAWPWAEVRLAAQEHDLRVVVPDQLGADVDQALIVATDWNRDVQRLVERGARPAALVVFASPITAWRLYYDLEQASARFPHTFMFEGARERVAPITRFHPLFYPVPCPPPRPTGLPWPNRRFLVAIADNQAVPGLRELGRWFDNPRDVSLRRTLAGLRYRPIARDRYQARLRAFEAFSSHDDFDLFGAGWQRRHPAVDPELHAATMRAYRGPVPDSEVVSLLAKYRFALVYENTRFPGYITDTILHCFFARCIPIYSGAPDVAQYIPPSAFIDVRQFVSFPELERFLTRITEDDARRYVDAAHAFLISPGFESWCVEHFARDLVEALVQVAEA
jgi:glycosyl transferase family 10 (putative fucosyltransferase)